MLKPGSLRHITFDRLLSGLPGPPQQSLSCPQSSPVGRQPLGGWQIRAPVGPYGKHARLQHDPPQVGRSPPSYPAPEPHSTPAPSQPVAPLDGTISHVPTLAPFGRWHSPPQHSVSAVQMSPVCVQNETATLQTPSLQKPPQHSPFALHALPAVLQLGLSGAHVSFVHVPLQHSPSTSQAAPSDVH